MKNFCIIVFFLSILISSCTVSKSISANKKYGANDLYKDYDLFRNILEDSHPGLYWYTSKDSMDFYFDKGRSLIKDSLNELGFRNILSYVVEKIRCGHTAVKSSKNYATSGSSVNRIFPLLVKTWADTAIVTYNINPKDSIIKRGYLITAIDNKPLTTILDSMFQHLSADGYNLTHKYQTLSNGNSFGSFYTSIFGRKSGYSITYLDSLNEKKRTTISFLNFPKDSARKEQTPLPPQPSRKERKVRRLQATRNLRYDTAKNLAIMDLNTFTKGYGLRNFFKRSFKKLDNDKIENLVIDLRGNGGGSITNSNLLTKYLAHEKFKIADSVYALKRNSPYNKYQNNRFSNWFFMNFMTRKSSDGNYHFKMYENRYFKPKKKNHYNGNVYILTGGNTFSAATLVAGTLKNQENVFIVGEETGGAAYGNNAWLIPDVTLPNTRIRFRLPLFRLIIDKDIPKDGRGILPEAEALPTVNDIRKTKDYKLEKVYELIKSNSR